MKADRKLFVIVAVYSVATLWWASAHAEEAWYTCHVVQTSPAWGDSYVKLTHEDSSPCFTDKWFKLLHTWDEKLQAITMSAKQNGRRVAVLADISRGVYPMVSDIRLIPHAE